MGQTNDGKHRLNTSRGSTFLPGRGSGRYRLFSPTPFSFRLPSKTASPMDDVGILGRAGKKPSSNRPLCTFAEFAAAGGAVGNQVAHIVTRSRFVVSGCSKALPLFPQLPFFGSPVELRELWERFSGFASVSAAGFIS